MAVSDRELFDAIGDYLEAKKTEHAARISPPEVTADEYAERAGELLDQRIRDTHGGDLGKLLSVRR